MKDLVKSRAEEQFAATQKKDNQARKERDNVSQERAEPVASLKVLRLAKEAADKEAAEKAAAEKAAAKKKATAFASGSPTHVTTERTAIEPDIDEARRG